MLVARTNAEAHLYMELHPCACGMAAFDRKNKLVLRKGRLLSVYDGACSDCGQGRNFEFALADELILTRGGVVYGGADPSTIIGPGEFLSIADSRARRIPGSPVGLDSAQREACRYLLEEAAAAIDEVLKFVPAGADAAPLERLISTVCKNLYAEEPGRFRRARLVAVAGAYRELLQRFLVLH